MDLTLQVAIVGFLGVFLGAIISIAGTYLTARATLKEQRRKARQDYLTLRMEKLSQSLAEYEVWLSKHPSYETPSIEAHKKALNDKRMELIKLKTQLPPIQAYTLSDIVDKAHIYTNESRIYIKGMIEAVSQELEELSKRQDAIEHEIAEHARIIGEAIASCLAVGDLPTENDIPDTDITPESIPDVPYRSGSRTHKIHRLIYVADRRLTRNFVTDGPEEKVWGHYQDRNRTALNHAVRRLSQLIEEAK